MPREPSSNNPELSIVVREQLLNLFDNRSVDAFVVSDDLSVPNIIERLRRYKLNRDFNHPVFNQPDNLTESELAIFAKILHGVINNNFDRETRSFRLRIPPVLECGTKSNLVVDLSGIRGLDDILAARFRLSIKESELENNCGVNFWNGLGASICLAIAVSLFYAVYRGIFFLSDVVKSAPNLLDKIVVGYVLGALLLAALILAGCCAVPVIAPLLNCMKSFPRRIELREERMGFFNKHGTGRIVQVPGAIDETRSLLATGVNPA